MCKYNVALKEFFFLLQLTHVRRYHQVLAYSWCSPIHALQEMRYHTAVCVAIIAQRDTLSKEDRHWLVVKMGNGYRLCHSVKVSVAGVAIFFLLKNCKDLLNIWRISLLIQISMLIQMYNIGDVGKTLNNHPVQISPDWIVLLTRKQNAFRSHTKVPNLLETELVQLWQAGYTFCLIYKGCLTLSI